MAINKSLLIMHVMVHIAMWLTFFPDKPDWVRRVYNWIQVIFYIPLKEV